MDSVSDFMRIVFRMKLNIMEFQFYVGKKYE